MESSTDPSARGREIRSNLDTILAIAESWLVRLRRRRQQVKVASAILTTLLVFAVFLAAVLGYILFQYTPSFFFEHPGIILILLVVAVILAVLGGVGSYMTQGRKLDRSLDELSNLISQTKIDLQQAQNQEFVSPDVLSLTEKILTLLPEVVRKRNQDSFLLGILAFVITLIPAKLPLAILIGALVWLYFRYEMNKGYDKEIARFEEQEQLFERRKSEFMQTL